MSRVSLSRVACFGVASLIAGTPGCDCLAFLDGPPDDGTKPPAAGPGSKLDDDIVALADAMRLEPEDPPEAARTAIENALVTTGFGVRGDGGFIAFNESQPQGIVFEPWDVDTMAIGMQQGLAQTLDDYASVWAGLVPGADAATLKSALLSDVAAGVASDNTARHAYAELLVALGRNSANGYDLLDPHVDGASPLDAVQLGLLTYRLSAELWMSVRNADGSQKTQALDAAAPCTQTETEGLVMDGAAVTASVTWGKILEHLGEKGISGADKFNRASQTANAALVYAKLAWTMAVFRMDMNVAPQPLERTLTQSPGAEATVSAKFRLDGTGKAQILNCMRIALNAINLDFSVPQDGPLAGKLVEWQVIAAGDDDVIQTASGDVLHKETSSSGESSIVVQGSPQKKSLSGKNLVDVVRRPKVRATTNLKNKDFAQDMIDASAGVGGLGALWSLPAELLNRIPLLFTGAVTVVVNDKKELIGDHFLIVGDYADPTGSETVLATNVKDHFEANIEVVIADDVLTATLLGWKDDPATLVDNYEAVGPGGEGCIQTTTIDGRTDPFTSRHKEVLQGFYVPNGNGLTEKALVTLAATGYRLRRGYHTTYDEPSCAPFDVPPQTDDAVLIVTFDSTMFSGVGSTIQIDQRSSGVGWLFAVTYVE